jgi:hypothetical protein
VGFLYSTIVEAELFSFHELTTEQKVRIRGILEFPRANVRRIGENVGEDFKGEHVMLDNKQVEWHFVTVSDDVLKKEVSELSLEEILASLIKVMEKNDYFWADRLDVMIFDLHLQPKTAYKLEVSYYQLPGADRKYTRDYVKTYTYFLEPAKYWASFQDLEIRIILTDDIWLPEKQNQVNYKLVKSNFNFTEMQAGHLCL